MEIDSLVNWLWYALVGGVVTLVVVTSWVWFIWSRIHAWRAARAGMDEEQTRPPGLVRVNSLLELFELSPWRLARLMEWRARRTGSWWDD